MDPRKLAELQARFQEAHVRHLMNETLRIAALEKAKDKVLSERNQLRTNCGELEAEVGRLKEARKELKQKLLERDSAAVQMRARMDSLEAGAIRSTSMHVQLAAALSFSRSEVERLSAAAERAAERAIAAEAEAARLPALLDGVASLERSLAAEQALRQRSSLANRDEIVKVNDLVDELRTKMTDYRGKYMDMQLEQSKVAPDEYREHMEALKAQGSFPNRSVPVEDLWARIGAQERQCTTLLDDNYQLRLRLEQTRWFEMEDKARLEGSLTRLNAELARTRRHAQLQRPHGSTPPTPPPSERPTTVAAVLGQAAAEGESPSRARTPLGPRLGQEGSPMRTLHLTEATQGPERLAARVAADHATQRGHSVVVGAVDPATTGARKGRWGDAAQPTSGGWAVHSRGSHRPGGDKGASPLRVPFDPRYPEDGGCMLEVRVGASAPARPATAAPDPSNFASAASMQSYQRMSFSSGISLASRPSTAQHWTVDAGKAAQKLNRTTPKSDKERGLKEALNQLLKPMENQATNPSVRAYGARGKQLR